MKQPDVTLLLSLVRLGLAEMAVDASGLFSLMTWSIAAAAEVEALSLNVTIPIDGGRADPDEPGAPGPCNYEYERNGTANVFMRFAPLERWRLSKSRTHHTAVEYAHGLERFRRYPVCGASTIVLVQDNLNIHDKASLYQAFPGRRSQGWPHSRVEGCSTLNRTDRVRIGSAKAWRHY